MRCELQIAPLRGYNVSYRSVAGRAKRCMGSPEAEYAKLDLEG
jgi:hypothetical protein